MLASIQNPSCSPASLPPAPPSYRNFLFIAPQETADARITEDKLVALARAFSTEGYVYVARSGQTDIEDDQFGVRYLPLTPDRLPSFGLLTAAFVVGDKTLAMAAAVEYETADVFLLEPSNDGLRTHRVRSAG